MSRKLLLSSVVLLVVFNFSFGQRITKRFKEIKDMVAVGDELFFAANSEFNNLELWKSDGTTTGTVLVKDIFPSSDRGSSLSELFAHNGILYFAADDGLNGVELWKSDGTESGTVLVKNIRTSQNFSSASSVPSDFFVYKGELFFSAIDNNTSSGRVLWKTDGTSEGTHRSPELSQFFQNKVLVAGEHLYLLTTSGKLWEYDGNTGERSEIEVDDLYFKGQLNNFNNELYFITSASQNDQVRVYKLNPTDDSLLMLAEFIKPPFGSLDVTLFIEMNGAIFFSVRTSYESTLEQEIDELWKTDGTVDGTSVVKAFDWNKERNESFMENFIEFNDQLYFRAGRGGNYSLWKSDGTEEGTMEVYADARIPATPPLVSGEQLFFIGHNYIYISDGTTEGTKRFSETQPMDYTNQTAIREVNGEIYFKAIRDDNLALWTTSPEPTLKIFKDTDILDLSLDDNIRLISKVDSCTVVKIKISNTGNADLALSEVTVSGIDFYLSGSIPKLLAVGETSAFDLLYFPSKSDPSTANLKFYSNDRVYNVFNVTLSGEVIEGTPEAKPQAVTLLKKLIPGNESDQIQLSSHSIVENSALSTEVGMFSLASGESGTTFSLAAGSGDRDNNLFEISGDKLLLNTSPDYENDNTLSIRVRSTNSANESIEHALTLNIINVNEDSAYDESFQVDHELFYGLQDVEYLDDNVIFAVGQKGAILRSGNGGEAWTRVNSGTSINLQSIQFTDNQTGYILGQNGLMLKTENSGTDWFLLRKTHANLNTYSSFYFASNDIGYLFSGDRGPYKTIDGGRSWTEQPMGIGIIYGGHFLDENRGFVLASSGNLYATIDGGLSWKSIRSLSNGVLSLSVHFVSENTGFIYSSNGAISKTTDGGETWSSWSSPLAREINHIYFQDENTAHAVGGGLFSKQRLFITEDGGLTWLEQELEPVEGSLQAIDFSPNGSKATMVGATGELGSYPGPGYSIRHWENNAGKTITSLPSVDFTSVAQTSEQNVFIFGDENLKSSDGGVIWKPMNLPTDSRIIESHFINETTGFVLSRHFSNRVYKTTDSGDSWTEVILSGNVSISYREIYFYNETIGFIMGRGNAIYKTTDGGNTWTQILMDIESYSSIESMHFFNELEGFAVSGINPKVLKTNDGGLTWTTIEEYVDAQWARSIVFLNDQVGIAAGHKGFMIRTEDGGSTWNEVKIQSYGDLFSMNFISEEHGYALWSQGITETKDGGLTWLPIYYLRDLYDLSEYNGVLYAVGTDGAVWKLSEKSLPTPTGYITGETLVPTNTVIDYKVPTSSNFNYTWEVSGINKLSYYDGNASIEWMEPGTFTVSVTANNSLGSGQSRTIDVTVIGLEPLIEGPEEVFKEEVATNYETALNSERSYIWTVTGALNYTPNNNLLSVDWSDANQGLISVLETDLLSGGRQSTTLVVNILDIVTSIEDDNLLREIRVFPNPSEKSLNISIKDYQNTELKIQIIDLSGTIHKSQVVSFTEQLELDIDDLTAGLYILEISSKKDKATWKIIKR